MIMIDVKLYDIVLDPEEFEAKCIWLSEEERHTLISLVLKLDTAWAFNV